MPDKCALCGCMESILFNVGDEKWKINVCSDCYRHIMNIKSLYPKAPWKVILSKTAKKIARMQEKGKYKKPEEKSKEEKVGLERWL